MRGARGQTERCSAGGRPGCEAGGVPWRAWTLHMSSEQGSAGYGSEVARDGSGERAAMTCGRLTADGGAKGEASVRLAARFLVFRWRAPGSSSNGSGIPNVVKVFGK